MENEGGNPPPEIQSAGNITPLPREDAHQLPSEKIDRLEFPYNFDGGQFLMNVSDSRNGFSLKTVESLTRFSEDRPNPFTDDEKKKIAAAMPGQMRFNWGNKAQEALFNYRQITATDADTQFISEFNKTYGQDTKKAKKMMDDFLAKNNSPKILAFKEFQERRDAYDNRAVFQIGIIDPQIVGNEIRVKTTPRSFPITNNFQDITNRKEALEQSSTSATSGNVFSKDGKMLVSLRDEEGSATYGGCGGAPASGYFDGIIDEKPSKASPTQGHRTLKPLETRVDLEIEGKKIPTRNLGERNVLKEMHEELGLDPRDVKETTLTGIAFVKKKTTHEFLYDIKMKLTAAEMMEQMAKERDLPPEEFAEQAVFIDATPEAIFTLCTKMVSPLALGHYAAFAASGYRLMLARDGKPAAEAYKKKLEVGIRENMDRINQIVREFVHTNPHVLTEPTPRQIRRYDKLLADYVALHPEASEEELNQHKVDYFKNQPKMDINGYNPQFTLREQGLADIQTALKEVGLVESNISQFPQRAISEAKAA